MIRRLACLVPFLAVLVPAQILVDFDIQPPSLFFGAVPVGSNSSLPFTITNKTDLTVTFTIASGNPAFSANPNRFVVPAGGVQQVTATFTPTQAGDTTGQLSVTGTAPQAQSTTKFLPVAGTGQAAFTVFPTSLNFGNVLLGCSATLTFQVNPASALNFLVTSSSPAFTVTPSNFVAQSPRAVTVTFTPNAPGLAGGTISVTAAGQTVGVGLGGVGVDVVLAPATLDFGSVLVGSTSPAQAVRLTTNPPVAATFTVSSSSSNAAFSSSAVGADGVAQVVFAPQTAGAFSGTITYTVSPASQFPTQAPPGCAVTRTVSVRGVGVVVDISLKPTSLDFGAVPVGTTSPPKSVVLSNNSSIDMAGTVTGTNSAFSVTPASFTVAAGKTQSFDVTFKPPATGAQLGSLTFALTGAQSTTAGFRVTVNLSVSGQGQTPCDLSLSAERLDFGEVVIGSSASRSVTVNNTGGGSCDVTASTSAPYSVTPASFTLAAGRSQAVTVGFSPAVAGPAEGAATFTAGAVTRRITLSGSGAANISVDPTTLDMGAAAVGGTNTRSVTVSNNTDGSVPVTASASPPFAVSPTSFTLGPRESRDVTVRFSPTAEGAFRGSVTFGAAGSRTVALTGTGVPPPALSFSFTAGATSTPVAPGGTIPLPNTSVGSSNSSQFQITNTGTVAATFNSIGSTGGAFSLEQLPPLPASVAPGASLAFSITFGPDSPGNAGATLSVDGRLFNLTGVGLVGGATITGTGGNVAPAQQQTVGLTLPRSYMVPVNGRLLLEFEPNAIGGNDPMIVFSNGTRTVDFSVDAGSTAARFGTAAQIGYQTGTVAGTIHFRAVLDAGGTDVTPTPAPSGAVTIVRAGPVIRSLTATRSAGTVTVTAIVFATTRELNNLQFQFTGAQGVTLVGASASLDVGAIFNAWYTGPGLQFGSLATATVPFTIQGGDATNIQRVSATAANGDGRSPAVEAAVGP